MNREEGMTRREILLRDVRPRARFAKSNATVEAFCFDPNAFSNAPRRAGMAERQLKRNSQLPDAQVFNQWHVRSYSLLSNQMPGHNHQSQIRDRGDNEGSVL